MKLSTSSIVITNLTLYIVQYFFFNLPTLIVFIVNNYWPIKLSCIKIADFHENVFDILKSSIIWDNSESEVVKGIVIASSTGNLGQSVSKTLYKK